MRNLNLHSLYKLLKPSHKQYFTYRIHKVSFSGPFTETNPNFMDRFIGRDTTSVHLIFNKFICGIETLIPWDQLLYPYVVEVYRLGLEPLWHSSPPLCNTDADRTGIYWGVRKDGNDWMRAPGYRVLMIKVLSAELLQKMCWPWSRVWP